VGQPGVSGEIQGLVEVASGGLRIAVLQGDSAETEQAQGQWVGGPHGPDAGRALGELARRACSVARAAGELREPDRPDDLGLDVASGGRHRHALLEPVAGATAVPLGQGRRPRADEPRRERTASALPAGDAHQFFEVAVGLEGPTAEQPSVAASDEGLGQVGGVTGTGLVEIPFELLDPTGPATHGRHHRQQPLRPVDHRCGVVGLRRGLHARLRVPPGRVEVAKE
jgi:hypothetical protein